MVSLRCFVINISLLCITWLDVAVDVEVFMHRLNMFRTHFIASLSPLVIGRPSVWTLQKVADFEYLFVLQSFHSISFLRLILRMEESKVWEVGPNLFSSSFFLFFWTTSFKSFFIIYTPRHVFCVFICVMYGVTMYVLLRYAPFSTISAIFVWDFAFRLIIKSGRGSTRYTDH